MQTRNSWVEAPEMHKPQTPLPRISTRTFAHCLNALYVHTKVLSSNVVSLHLYLAERGSEEVDTLLLLSQLHLELFGQANILQNEINQLQTPPGSLNEWSIYMDLWRIPVLENIREGVVLIHNATDELTLLYESILPLATKQRDQARTFYLLANHLETLLAYLPKLKQAACEVELPISRITCQSN